MMQTDIMVMSFMSFLMLYIVERFILPGRPPIHSYFATMELIVMMIIIVLGGVAVRHVREHYFDEETNQIVTNIFWCLIVFKTIDFILSRILEFTNMTPDRLNLGVRLPFSTR